jgi:uncharacterized protein YndB with AHSA1/START domain
MQIPDRIEREVRIDAPIERVWALVTEAEHFGGWFADSGAEIDLRPGGAMTLSWEEHGTVRARVRVVESGFASLDTSDQERQRQVDDNTKGWAIQLGNLAEHAGRALA